MRRVGGKARLTRLKIKGFSYLEFVIALALIIIFIGVALKMLVNFLADAERMEMEEVLLSLHKTVSVLKGTHMVDSDFQGLSQYHEANPMTLLKLKPENYLGERGDRDRIPESGNWFYNYDRKSLIYRVKHDGHFVGSLEAEDQVEFKLKFIFADNNKNERFDQGVDVAQGLELKATHNYQWVD